MRLKLQLPAKAGRFHIFECEAVRLVTLPDEEFQDFLNGPHQDGRWAAEPFYADEHGRRIYQGVLVLGEGHKDGVFAYDGGKHFAYLPGARAVVDSILEQAVEKIIREGAENTNEGSWCYYFSELYEQMGLVIEDGNGFDTMLLEKLEQRPEAADVTLTDECFDVCYYLDYCKNLAPEQPAPSLSAERKEEIISGILNYMAEYFDDSSLYDILHNTLEICNDEIGCLGFALYDEYVDEQIEASEVQSDLLPKSGRLVNLLSAYEELQQIPDEERITHLAPGAFGYCLDPNVPDERLHTAYQQALSALELESDEIQEAESFTSRDEIISRMRDCLLAKELTAGDKVLFVAICTSRIGQTARDAAGRPSEPLLWSWDFPALRSSGRWMTSVKPVCCKSTHAGGKTGVLLPICIMWYDGGVQCWLRSICWIIWLIKWDAEFFPIFGCLSKVNGCTGSLPRSL